MALDYQPLYILGSGMLLQERKLGVIANNIANTDTPSFKRDLLIVESWFTESGNQIRNSSPENPSNNFVYPMISSIYTVFSQGSLRETSNPLDFAIEGEGFFAVRTPEGIRYTRKGNFSLDRQGFLVTEEGYRVLSDNLKDIRIPQGNIRLDSEGNIYVEGELTEKIGVWDLTDIRKEGFDFFTGIAQPANNYRVLQGFLEESNVNPVEEMVRLIETSRAHEVYTRLIQTVDEIQGKVNTLIR